MVEVKGVRGDALATIPPVVLCEQAFDRFSILSKRSVQKNRL